MKKDKIIEQDFCTKVGDNCNIEITGTSRRIEHRIKIDDDQNTVTFCLTTVEMMELSEFIKQTAEEIDSDSDFKPKVDLPF